MKKRSREKMPLPAIGEEKEEPITAADFKFAVRSEKSHEQRFETKPTTFLKDSIRRFSKNKSSVVATYILGFLILCSLAVPIIDRNDIKILHTDQNYLEPKLFPAGTGFWDGVKHYDGIAYDRYHDAPDPEAFTSRFAVMPGSLKPSEVEYVNTPSKYAYGGFFEMAYQGSETISSSAAARPVYMESTPMKLPLDLSHGNAVSIVFGEEFPEEFPEAEFRFYMKWHDPDDEEPILYLTDYRRQVGTDMSAFDINAAIESALPEQGKSVPAAGFEKPVFGFQIENGDPAASKSIMIESCVFSTDNPDEEYRASFAGPSFTNANIAVSLTERGEDISVVNPGYWKGNAQKLLYKAEFQYCSFDYDTYEAALGRLDYKIPGSKMDSYVEAGWCEYDSAIGPSSFKVLDEKRCPVITVYKENIRTSHGVTTRNLDVELYYYKYLGYRNMPVYLLGTDSVGRDMFKYVFEGLRTSLILGTITFAVCFAFGLLWGSISGYFGGNVDLAMERLTDILSGVPWIVVMTLCILHLGQNFVTFALALCLTGWIGTASLTRTQFYRFKGREYVLASRTLGSSDMRLIFKHILPNAMGTIITAAVLMIPSVIFSEATISYLGLGLQGMSSLGVILSSNQSQLLNHPYLIIFPSVVMALIMISFNLFGNGLRDAINPSLKGEEER